MQSRTNKRRKPRKAAKIISKVILILSLFFFSSSIVLSQIFPEGLKIASEVQDYKVMYYIIGGLGGTLLAANIIIQNPFKSKSKSGLKLFIIFVLYSFFHLFLELTNSLNDLNFKFNFGYMIENHWFRGYWIITLITFFLIASSFILKNRRVNRREKVSQKENKQSSYLYPQYLALLLFLDSFTSRMVWGISFGPINSRGVYQLSKPATIDVAIFSRNDFLRLLGDLALVFAVLLIVSYIVCNGITLLAKNKTGFSLAFTASLFQAFIFNYFIQLGVRGEGGSIAFQGTFVAGATMFQVLVLLIIFLTIYILINRFIMSTLLILIIFGGFSIGNFIKFSLREEPIYVSELSWLKSPKVLFSFIDGKMILVSIIMIVVLIIVALLLRQKFYKGKLTTWKLRGFVLVSSIALFGIISQNFVNFTKADSRISIPIISRYLEIANGDILWHGLPYTARFKSEAFVWMRQGFGKVMDEPQEYDKAKVEEIAKKYTALAQKLNASRTEKITDQTVIYILSESLANPNRITGINLSENPLSNIDNIKNTASGGIMFSNGYGGGTANMEIQALNSLPKVNYSDSVSIINSDVIPKMSFVPSISNYFDSKIVLHPENATNYNRNIIYKKLGFQHFYALTNTDKKDLLENQEKLDGRVTDAQTYTDILEKIDISKNQFFSVLTMQNHMPYTSYSGSSKITANGDSFDSNTNHLLQNYARKINTTDEATKMFLDELQKLDKKITVVFYGDHLPGIYPTASAFQDDPLKQYETDYFIWTNQGNEKNIQRNINSSEFTPALFETQNAKVSPYYALLTKVMQELPAEYDSALGSTVKLSSKQKEILEDLKIIQYDLTEGKGYLKSTSSFYKLP